MAKRMVLGMFTWMMQAGDHVYLATAEVGRCTWVVQVGDPIPGRGMVLGSGLLLRAPAADALPHVQQPGACDHLHVCARGGHPRRGAAS